MHGGRPTRYRQPWRVALPFFAMAAVAGPLLPRWVTAALGLAVLRLIQCRRSGLDLTEEHAVVRGYDNDQVPWSDVSDIRPGHWTQGPIVLRTASGRPVVAPAPCSWWGGPATAEQVAQVTQWWLDHRGAAWTPPAGPRHGGPRPPPASLSSRFPSRPRPPPSRCRPVR